MSEMHQESRARRASAPSTIPRMANERRRLELRLREAGTATVCAVATDVTADVAAAG